MSIGFQERGPLSSYSSKSESSFGINRFWQTRRLNEKLPHGIFVSRSEQKAMINTPSSSLEDCHTNVLALTELSGLKWRRLSTPDNYVYNGDLDTDPILSAYSLCVKNNVLCTWRRRQRQETASSSAIENIPLRLDTPKELWIFWYSIDEPELIKVLMKEKGLISTDDTDFAESAIKYETRTQFFKSLHNVLERNMLKSGYVRFGRWFTRPLDEFSVSPDCALPSYIHGLRFEFAVQGENHVCATVKTQCQPPILRLNAKHLQSTNGKPLPVILAPWSIRAQLSPQQPLKDLQNTDQLSSSLNSSGFSLLQSSMQQQQAQPSLPDEVQSVVDDQWSQWNAMMSMASTPCCSVEDSNEQNENLAPSNGKIEKLPRFVVVEVDGVRMFYPSCFVGLVAQDLAEHEQKNNPRTLISDDLDLNDSLVGFSQDSQIDLLEIRRQKVLAVKKKETFVPEVLRHSRKTQVGVRIARRSFEDACLAASVPLPTPSLARPSNEPNNSSSASSTGPNQPPPLQRIKTETGLHLNMPSTSASTTSAQASDDLRWNYFDYLRKEYCYCAMCSAGGGNMPEGQSIATDSKQPSSTKNPGSSSSAQHVFHRTSFNDRLGPFGTDPNLFSPPQHQQKVASPEQTQKDLDFLRQLDEKERAADPLELKIPIFARTIAATQRTAIPSERLIFASVQECNFNNLYERHLGEIAIRKKSPNQQDENVDFEPFTPITRITPDREANQEFINPENQWNERIRTFNYPYHPGKTDFLGDLSYHVQGQRDKPIGPRLKASSAGDSSRDTPAHSSTTPAQTQSSSLLKSLLDVPDDDPDCQQPMRRLNSSPQSQQAEEQQWKQCIGEALKSKQRPVQRRFMSRREEELRRWYDLRSQGKISERVPPITRPIQYPLSNQDRSFSTNDLSDSANLRDRLMSPPMQLNRSMQDGDDNAMEVDQQMEQSIQTRGSRQRRKSLPASCSQLDPVMCGEESTMVDKGALDSIFYGRQIMDRFMLCDNDKTKKMGLKARRMEENAQRLKNKSQPDTDYQALRRRMHDDLIEVEDPKTPIANLNSSLSSTQILTSSSSSTHPQDLQQMFTSNQANDVHSILSPPASNEQVDGNPLASIQQHTPGDKSQPMQAQSLVPIGQNALMLHSSGWNTTAISANNSMHDSLNIIYPTPPTPLQQFSPLNANQLMTEDPQAKRRRLVNEEQQAQEYSETEHDNESMNESDELMDQRHTNGKLNGFLAVDILNAKKPLSPIYNPKRVGLPPYSDRFTGDLLDDDVEPKKKLRWLKHLKREPEQRRQRLKEDLKKRSMRRDIVLPPEYICQSKYRRLFGPLVYNVYNSTDLQKLAENAIELASARRKPISGYGSAAVIRLNQAYMQEKRHWEMRNGHRQDDQRSGHMMRQFSASGANGIFPPQQMMMYGGNQGPRPPFNPYFNPQQQFAGTPMTPQQQMMMASGPHLVGQAMQMGRQGQASSFNASQMHPNGPSPGYPAGATMPPNSNFNRVPFNPQQRLGGHGSPMGPSARYPNQQQNSQQMLGYFNAQSPASSLGSNPSSQHDPNQQQQAPQRPGSVAIGPASVPGQIGSVHAPLPFGSPGIPMAGSAGAGFQRTPSMPPSVAAAANNLDASSSVANQSVFSVENPSSALVANRSQFDQVKIDEVLSLFQNCRSKVIAILMKDTILDLFYDSVFDACPICSCNANIRSAELGLYVQAPAILADVLRIQQRQQQDQTFKADYWSGLMMGGAASQCSCGFSAVRHRFLCGDGRGLFAEDVQEAGGTLSQFKALGRGNDRSWSKKKTLNELMDCLRFLSLNRNLATSFKQAYYLGEFPTEDVFAEPNQFALSSTNSNYILSRVDLDEFDIAVRSVVQVAKGQSWTQPSDARLKKSMLLHPWGFQIANQVREPKDQECLSVVREIQCVLERSMKEVRGIEANNPTNIVEGPLTWRSFHRKCLGQTKNINKEDDSFRPEQIPQILVSADRDPIATNPQLVHLWEKLTMGPYDQAKDVLYLAVVPDSNVIVEKCKVYLEELSTIYEKCRFGRHVKLATKDAPRDGIIRVNMKSSSMANAAAQGLGANSKFNEEDRKLHLRISAFCDQVLAELKAAVVNNETIFERRAYYETLYRDSLQPNYTSLATSTDSNYMPPPAMPLIQSPPSILSTASGPASQPLNPMSNPPATSSSLFSAPNTNQLPSPALSTGDNLMEPLRTPEVSSVGTPGDQQQQQAPPSQHLSPEAVEKAVDEMLSEDHQLSLPHLIVIYLVNPFTFGSDTCSSKVSRSAGLFLMKTFNSLLAAMSLRRRPQLQIELVNLQTLYDYSSFVADPLREERQLLDDGSRNDKASAYDCLRRVAFSVYSQTRLLIPDHVRGAIPSSMTRFGPASSMSDILDDLKRRDPPLYFKVPTMPFVLAPMEVLGVEATNNKVRLLNTSERVLFVSYCLPSDDFLCAAVTDQYGHLADNVVINLHVDQPPNQLRYKNRSQIFDAIYRLWLYIQSVLTMETRNWRLVVARVGKIGHGEFKAWSQILSKNSLRSFNQSFKGRDRGDGLMSAGLDSASSASNCRTCQQTAGTQEVPIILSACLLSMEAESNLRLFSSSNSAVDLAVAVGKSKSSTKNTNSQTQIIDDPSITHIVAFPISPDIMDAQNGGNQQAGQEDETMFEDLHFDMDDDLGTNIDQLMGNTDFDDINRADAIIDHQPMAIGYIVSTAPANDLPDWFWSSCPSMKRQLPVHLKNALHINSSNIHDELSIGQKTANETFHPLDDLATDILLKHIMKMHNSLSWLNVDVANGTRHSCLPVHMQALFRLQRTIETIYS